MNTHFPGITGHSPNRLINDKNGLLPWALSSACRQFENSSPSGRSSHPFGRFDSKKLQRGDELDLDKADQLLEKLLLGQIIFREDVMMVMEQIEGLRELENVLRGEGRLLCRDCDPLQ
jgi:hypothetical protein